MKKLTFISRVVLTAVFLVGFLFANTSQVFSATTASLVPNGQGSWEDWNAGAATIDGDAPLCSDYVDETVTGDRESFTVDISSIPNGTTITDVAVNVWDREVGGSPDGSYKTFVRLNGTDTDATSELAATGTGSGCSAMKTQNIDVGDTLKSGATTLEVGVLKTATDTDGARVGAVTVVITYVLADQTITFGSLSAKTYGDADFPVSATSDSGLTVSFSSQTPAVCTVTPDGLTTSMVSAGTCTVRASQAGDASYNPAPDVDQSFTVNKATLTIVGMVADNQVYDGTNVVQNISGAGTLTGIIGADVVSANMGAGSYAFDNKNAGTGKTVTASGITLSGANAGNYILTQPTTTADIAALPITVTAVTDTKVYDSTTSSAGVPSILPALVGGDTSGFSQTFDTADVGTGKTLTASGVVNDGNGGANYAVTFADDTTGEITALPITVTPDALTKPYGGNDPTLTYGVTGTLLGGDNFSGALDRASGEDVGNYAINKGTLALSSNYNLIFVSGVDFTISPKAVLTVTADDQSVTYGDADPAFTFVYSGFLTPEGALVPDDASMIDIAPTCSVSGAHTDVNSYAITCSGGSDNNYDFSYVSGNFVVNTKAITATADAQSKSYGDADPVLTYTTDVPLVLGDSFSGSLDRVVGEDVGSYAINQGTLALSTNYVLNFVSNNLDITPKVINVTADDQTKTYGDADPALTYTFDPLFVPDVLTGSLSRISGENVNTYNITLGTLSAGLNYTLNLNTAELEITQRPLTVKAQTDTKLYDGTNSSDEIPTLFSGSLAFSDTVTWTQAYDNKNAGTGKTLIPAGTVNDGNGGNNYDVTFLNDTTGVITQQALTVTSAANTKTYDGDTSASTLPTISGTIAPGDTANFIETYNTKNIGAGKSLIPSGSVNDGNSGNNYAVTFVNSTNGIITAKELTIDGLSAGDKTYDGNTSAIVTGLISLNGVVGIEDVAIAGSPVGTFADKNAGAGKNVAVSGLSLTGTDAGNYTLTQPTLTATISQAPLTITAQTNSKTYDGDNSAGATPLVSGLVGGDTATGLVETYDNENAGSGKTLSVSAYTINDGNSGANYNVSTVVDTTGVISQRVITVTSSANTKTYDGDTSASATPTITSGTLASGDVANFTETYDNKNIGTGKTLIPAGTVTDGNSGDNYAVSFVTSANGVINAKDLTISGAIGNDKVYDGDNTATVDFTGASLVGVVAPDVVIIDSTGYSAAFADENVGNNKAVTVVGVALTGADAGNYTVSQPTGLDADITARPLTVTAQTDTKVYDGTTNSAVLPLLTSGSLVEGDTVTWSQTYDDKNVDTGKTLTPAGTVTDGNGGNNYAVTFVEDTTGEITEKTLVVSALGSDKVYDGNTDAIVTLSDDRVEGDTLSLSYGSASFADKNVGTEKSISVADILVGGTDAGNYSYNTTASATADITVRTLNVTATGNNKVYDATITATVNFADNRVEGDTLTVSGTATFDTKNVGTEKTVNVTGITISGTDAGNYSQNTTTGTTADITPTSLTVVAAAQNKVVDGNTTATVTLTNDAFLGDVVTQTYTTADFSDALVGTGKTVTVLGIAIAGADAGNYTLASSTATTTADITSQPSSGGGSGSRARPRTVTPTPGEVLGATKFVFTLLLKQGVVAPVEVMELQKFLNNAGFGPLVVDGKFGPMTKAAVIKFQLANGLKGDGVVGPLTRAVLNK